MKIFWSAVVLLALVFAAVIAYREMRPRSPVPEQLLGVWKTDNSAYADRYFEVRQDTIEVGRGEGGVSIQSIFRVDTKAQDGRISCLIRTYSSSLRTSHRTNTKSSGSSSTIQPGGEPSI